MKAAVERIALLALERLDGMALTSDAQSESIKEIQYGLDACHQLVQQYFDDADFFTKHIARLDHLGRFVRERAAMPIFNADTEQTEVVARLKLYSDVQYSWWHAYDGEVFRGSEHMQDWEGRGPYSYRERELMEHRKEPWSHCSFHVVLGQQRIRFCAFMDGLLLVIDGREVDLQPFVTGAGGHGEIEGYHFSWVIDGDPTTLRLALTEPDGTAWTGVSAPVPDTL